MEYFDAYQELHDSLEKFIQRYGVPPTRVRMSPALYQWLRQILREEALLKNKAVEQRHPTRLETAYGTLQIVIDESLSDWNIIVE